jgi:hypothetical protein
MNCFLVLNLFEKRERPKVIAEGHRDAIIDCLYKNANTGDVHHQNFLKNNFLLYLFSLIMPGLKVQLIKKYNNHQNVLSLEMEIYIFLA